ncbi:GNAT family N-acetyltransferase [Nocardioides marmorisolisilvae]|uniref:GNAT family N-acetyltransferase n=1 Tax=Nocardioides marmorisolisilvae TaxID=1542737 RepID=A0A3N0DQ10_9ACTN|nr:GNAT family N-acetyltransferase [Nocardioides marmorisolisilvae]RNL77734.1 GNAT family N-acetyltransferase [Nocardioides marmorisolisilvae]
MTTLRPIAPADHAAVLAWNEANVELLAPLSAERLIELLDQGEGMIIEEDGTAVGFVFTFLAGSPYSSPNYAWFSARHEAFLYLDRVVVDSSVRRTGVGGRVYDLIEQRAAEVGPVMCLEVNLDPPNEPSLAFHRSRGYVEVGQQVWSDHLLTMMEKQVG